MRHQNARHGVRLVSEGGFSLIEATAAIGLIAIVFITLSFGMVASLRSVRSARMFQQATSMGNRFVEQARDVHFDTLMMKDTDLTGDPNVISSCGSSTGKFFDPDGPGPLVCEKIVSSAVGGNTSPHITNESIGTQKFTVKRYVTWVDQTAQGGPGQDYKRSSIIINWREGTLPRAYTTSTFVTRARRGLPVSKYDLSPASQTKSFERGQTVVFAYAVKNLGIIDAYDLTMPVPAGRSWTIEFYKDIDGDQAYDPLKETLFQKLTDTNSSGVVDTGNLTTDTTFLFLAVWRLSPTEPEGTENLTLTARSGADNSITRKSTAGLTIIAPGLVLFLHDNPSPPIGHTNAQANMTMNLVTPTVSSLFRYSQNLYAATSGPDPIGGRYIAKGGSGIEDINLDRMTSWVYQIPRLTHFSGNARLTINVAAKDFICGSPVTFRVFLRDKPAATATTGNAWVGGSGVITHIPVGVEPCKFAPVTLLFPANATVEDSRWIELKIIVDGTGVEGLFAYDTLTFTSTLKLPQVTS